MGRDDLRHERHKDRARQRNIDRAAPERRSKLERNRERDISEQIALGIPAKTAGASGEGLFDSRLFNQSRGSSSGYGDDEAYNVYSEPWRKDNNLASNIYRPGKNIDKEAYGGQEIWMNYEKRIDSLPTKNFREQIDLVREEAVLFNLKKKIHLVWISFWMLPKEHQPQRKDRVIRTVEESHLLNVGRIFD